jgi:hypothetical protein
MKRTDPSLEDSAKAFVQSKLGVKANAMKYYSGSSGKTVKNTYLTQMYDGVHFANAVANVAFNRDGKVVAFGSSFVKPSQCSIPFSVRMQTDDPFEFSEDRIICAVLCRRECNQECRGSAGRRVQRVASVARIRRYARQHRSADARGPNPQQGERDVVRGLHRRALGRFGLSY